MRQLNFRPEPFGGRHRYTHNQQEDFVTVVGRTGGNIGGRPVVIGRGNIGGVRPVFRAPGFFPGRAVIGVPGMYNTARVYGSGVPGIHYPGIGGANLRRRWHWLHRAGQPLDGMDTQAQSSDVVMQAQACLAQIVGNVPQDGIMGRATRHALQEFQTRAQMPATGMLDEATMAALQAACSQQGGAPAGGPPPPAQPPTT